MLRGEYVILRVPEVDDAAIMTAWKSDRDVTRYIAGNIYPVTKRDQEEYIRQLRIDEKSRSFIVETEDEIPIGICSLSNIDWINSTAEIKVVLYAKNCWGRGYGFDTVRALTNYGMFEMNLHTIYVNIMDDNERAIKCFEKAGYEVEGRLYYRVFKEGNYKNMVSMSIFKSMKQEA